MKKTDNTYLESKLRLRRWFLSQYHPLGTARVLDCCCGSQRLWTTLRAEHPIATYFPLDQKRGLGAVRVKSERVLGLRGISENVIDIDTYGQPWKHWYPLLANVTPPTTVFLTVTTAIGGLSNLSKHDVRVLGLRHLPIPSGVMASLARLAIQYHLAAADEHGLAITCAKEAFPHGNDRYLGLRLEAVSGEA